MIRPLNSWDRRVGFFLAWLLFAWFRLWQATTAPPLIWQDSKDYEAVGSHALWSGAFWFGTRPVLAPFLWKLTGSAGGFVIGQAVVSVVAWGVLAWSVASVFPQGWRRAATYLVVLAFATTTPVAMWDRSVLSESLALSGLALLFAASIRLASTPSPVRAGAFVLAALWCALARDSQIIVPALLGVVMLVTVLVRRRPVRRILLPTSVVLLLAAGFCVATVLQSERDTQNITDVMYARVFPYPATVAWFASHGMPEARQIDRLAHSEPPPPTGTAKFVFPNLSAPAFAPLRRWIDDHGAATYTVWMVTHPWDVVLDPLRRPERTFNDAQGDIYAYAALNRVTSGLTPVLWPPWFWLEGMIAVATVVAFVRRMWSDRVIGITALLGVIGVLAMIWAWNGDGQEATRHTLEGLAEVHLGALLLLLYVLLAHTPGRTAAVTNMDAQVTPESR